MPMSLAQKSAKVYEVDDRCRTECVQAGRRGRKVVQGARASQSVHTLQNHLHIIGRRMRLLKYILEAMVQTSSFHRLIWYRCGL